MRLGLFLLIFCALSPLFAFTENEALTKLEAEVWQNTLESFPEYKQKYGMPLTSLPDVSYEGALRQKAFYERILRELETIDRTKLSTNHRLTHAVIEHQARLAIDGTAFYWHAFRGIPYGYPRVATLLQMAAVLPVKTDAERTHYLSILDQFELFIIGLHASFTGQAERGIRLPQPQIDSIQAYFQSFISDPDKNPLQVNPVRLEGVDQAKQDAFRQVVANKISGSINPAWAELAGLFGPSYRGKAPKNVGVKQFPDGDRYYRYLIRLNVGLNKNPEEIHQIGLTEVARIEKAMADIRKEVGFSGDRSAFHAKLKKDQRFFAKSPEDVEALLMKHHRRIEPLIDQYFRLVPKTEGGVARLHPSLEASMTFGYYQWPTKIAPRGTYFFNGSKLEERSQIQAQALIYHELIPGHHFQLALLFENENLSVFRQNYFDTANVEGWGEYASSLGMDMNLYTDPYDRYGRHLMDMFISVRLVVDTGMNALGWSREKASAYMRERTLRSDTEIASETLRYSVAIPGQALAYKLGSLKILELRKWAREQKGVHFDIRDFHAAVLEEGSLPLPVLENHVKSIFR